MKTIFMSKIKILVEINGQTQKVYGSNSIILPEQEVVRIIPLENGFLPIILSQNSISQYVKKINFQNYCLLELNSLPQILSGEFFLSKNIKNGVVSVVGIPYKFNIEIDSKQYHFEISKILSNIKILETKKLIILESESLEKDYYVLFHKQEQKFYEFFGSVEISENNIKAVIDKNTLSKHGEVLEYNITENSCELVSKELVYLNEKPCLVPPFLTHIAFFEAIQQKDFFLAKTFLSNELTEKLTAEHLSQFFGDFDSFRVINQKGEIKIALLVKIGENEFNAKVFNLTFCKEKICDINEEN